MEENVKNYKNFIIHTSSIMKVPEYIYKKSKAKIILWYWNLLIRKQNQQNKI